MYCAKGNFPHVQCAFYLHAIDARRVVKCGMASVTWCDVTANHRRATHSIPHFTFRIPHAAVLHFMILPILPIAFTSWMERYSHDYKFTSSMECSSSIRCYLLRTT